VPLCTLPARSRAVYLYVVVADTVSPRPYRPGA
jgi:hypothetical protein